MLKGFNCVWWFIRVVLHVGSVCQSDIRLIVDLFKRPAHAITRVEILYEVDFFNKLTSRFVSLKINDLGSYKKTTTLYKLPERQALFPAHFRRWVCGGSKEDLYCSKVGAWIQMTGALGLA